MFISLLPWPGSLDGESPPFDPGTRRRGRPAVATSRAIKVKFYLLTTPEQTLESAVLCSTMLL